MTRKTWIILIGIFLALLVACAAVAVLLVINLAPTGGRILGGAAPVLGGLTQLETVSAEAEEEFTLPAGEAAALDLENQFGNLTLRGEAGLEEIRVTAKKTAWEEDQAAAEAALEQIEILTGEENGVVTIRVQQPEQSGQNRADSVDFTIAVPLETDVKAVVMSGGIEASGLEGDVDLESAFGSVQADDILGLVRLSSRSGEVSARQVDTGDGTLTLNSDFGRIDLEEASAGEVTVENRNGDINLDDVRSAGAVTLKSDFGSVTFRNGQAASLNVEASAGGVTLSQIDAGESVRAYSKFGAVNLENVSAGSFDLGSDSGEVRAEGVQGEVKVRNQFGDIFLSSETESNLDLNTRSGRIDYRGGLGAGPHTLVTEFGEVRLSLPEDSSFDFDLTTGFGDIDVDFPVDISGEPDEKHWTGQVNGGGPSLAASSRNGGIVIEELAP